MNSKKKFIYIVCVWMALVLTIAASRAFAVPINVSVERNPVSLEESFKISFTANESPDGDPDFTPLERDFNILNQNQSSSSSWVQGSYSRAVKWMLEVTAKKTGRLVIPAIQFGDDTSEPLTITVNEKLSEDDVQHNNEELFLEVKASPEQPYVQSQVIYTVRLYRRVDVAQAELSEPELEDAVVEKLGEDSNFNTVVNGVSYLVTERKYAIFPQKSGSLKIKPLALTAEIIALGRPDFRDFFGSRMTKTKRIMSKEMTLDVKPVPQEFKGKDWLAAERLELSQAWSGDTQQMKIGEPLTRTLTLKATGATVGQLPELNTLNTDDKIKAYPDQPTLNEQKQNNGIVASRQEKIAIIPAAAGKYVLPAIEIPWFNTQTHKMQVVKLPEVTINIPAGNVSQAEKQPSGKAAPQISATADASQNSSIQTAVKAPEDEQFWPWLSLVLGIGWLTTLIYFLKQRSNLQGSPVNNKDHPREGVEQKAAIKSLKLACAEDNAQDAKNALLVWGRRKFGVNNLGALAACCDARLRDEIVQLNQALYSKEKHYYWSGKRLLQAFSEHEARKKAANTKKDEDGLEPLFRV